MELVITRHNKITATLWCSIIIIKMITRYSNDHIIK